MFRFYISARSWYLNTTREEKQKVYFRRALYCVFIGQTLTDTREEQNKMLIPTPLYRHGFENDITTDHLYNKIYNGIDDWFD